MSRHLRWLLPRFFSPPLLLLVSQRSLHKWRLFTVSPSSLQKKKRSAANYLHKSHFAGGQFFLRMEPRTFIFVLYQRTLIFIGFIKTFECFFELQSRDLVISFIVALARRSEGSLATTAGQKCFWFPHFTNKNVHKQEHYGNSVQSACRLIEASAVFRKA